MRDPRRVRDPRREKLRNFRRQGHCRHARCGLCHPHKRWKPARDKSWRP